ncbi:hypothetical protein KSP39_PZI009596 [Platanthera zijinensis]|uniref:Uncharacterized protein n=1 Tax=Platanthera zijinensis TaxID=2320716 RepID=A0AAP0BKQ7_9ASPA
MIYELESSMDNEIQKPTLQKIPSGKILIVDVEHIALTIAICGRKEQRLMRSRDPQCAKRREKREQTKSLSKLVFEEVKGFIDLGFKFSDAEESDPWLISILSGPQPYLSEAWDAAEEE